MDDRWRAVAWFQPRDGKVVASIAILHEGLDVPHPGIERDKRGHLLRILGVGAGFRPIWLGGDLLGGGGIGAGAQTQRTLVIGSKVKAIPAGDRHMDEASHWLAHVVIPVGRCLEAADEITLLRIGWISRVGGQTRHADTRELRPPFAGDLASAEIRK